MKIVAVTSCPSGVAHTYMAAEALKISGKKAGAEVRVETQGGSGIEDALTAKEIEAADFVVLTKDISIKGEERFQGKMVVRVAVADAVKKSDQIIGKLREKYEQLNAK
ncbi:PTS fructose-like transporter subunit IIB [Paenibacillus sp. HN-1]|uniref:PTS fructose-like transporter subunit IIB n=1 Tax=Paenibacillus TaxID=44249 RepID=UPI001CA7C086|nr:MULTISPECIES: PTS fructose-like transporter subunit IIB [Paenibacillus]MBY9077809.1 PTS fructose-like transporter subunit IIB [Paenibacillus sp. CGMCC 1.18879]MBY9088235.1 PTS fructose-like transporter subunit IIB [Paenibacillus sinensis]